MHKILQSEGFLGRSLGPLLETGLCLIENVLKSLAKNIIALELTALKQQQMQLFIKNV